MKMSPSKKGLLPIVASFLTGVLVFDFEKNRNRPTVKFQNFGNRNARFCRLGAKSMAGTGPIEGMGGGVTTFIALRVGVNASRVPPKDVPANYGQDALFVKRWLARK
jgi:hypothetical protein